MHPPGPGGPPPAVREQELRRKVFELARALGSGPDLAPPAVAALAKRLLENPLEMVREAAGGDIAPVVLWNHPEDLGRTVPVPPGRCLLFRAGADFEVTVYDDGRALARERAFPAPGGGFAVLLAPLPIPPAPFRCGVEIAMHREATERSRGSLLFLPVFRGGSSHWSARPRRCLPQTSTSCFPTASEPWPRCARPGARL